MGPVVQSALQRAHGAHKNAFLLRLITLVFAFGGLFAILATLLFLWVANLGLWSNVIGLVVAFIPWLLAVYSQLATKSAHRNRDESLRLAYAEQIVALLYEMGSPIDANRIASLIGLSVERTESLLANLNTDDRMSSDVTDDGEIVYAVRAAEPVRVSAPRPLRVDSSVTDPRQVRIAPANSEFVDAEFDDTARAEIKPPHRS